MQKYIFLDIDGVIATPKCSNIAGKWQLCSGNQRILKRILKETGAKIVLSSSWRLHTLEDTIKHMEKNNFWFCDKLIGVTIRGYHYIDRTEKIHLSIPRGVEIKQWIDTHIHSDGNGYSSKHKKKLGEDFIYVILDDNSDMLLEQKDYFIHTNSFEGLTDEDADLAIKILNNK